MRDSEIYDAHAARCRTEAANADLENVRDRALRAEAAWIAMAARSLKTEASRDARIVHPGDTPAADGPGV